ncbi:MAG: chorismate-binding protein [Verrucomicrobiales bacterium]
MNPSPYMFCLQLGRICPGWIITEVRASDQWQDRHPLHRRHPRGKTEEETTRSPQSCCADFKERAEHIMLVDLARNDVGRIAGDGSVEVNDFHDRRALLARHALSPTSPKTGRGLNRYDVIRATFLQALDAKSPRLLQIINSLEKSKRGNVLAQSATSVSTATTTHVSRSGTCVRRTAKPTSRLAPESSRTPATARIHRDREQSDGHAESSSWPMRRSWVSVLLI